MIGGGILRLVVAIALALLVAGPAVAQGLFSPVIRVNDKAITLYEIQQRERLLGVLGVSGNLRDEAIDALIADRLQLQAAEAQGIVATEEGIAEGIAEFAARADATPEAFLAGLRQAGVAEETFRDFVRAGIVWRDVVQARFGPRAQVTEDDVDRAVALAGQRGGARVLISEILLPARTPQEAAAAQARAEEFSRIRSFATFAQTARDFSAAGSRAQGGRVDRWLPLGELPPPMRNQFLTMPIGGVTDPVELPNAIGVFQLRAFEEVSGAGAETVAIDYAEFLIPGGTAEDAMRIAGRVDTCDDLYGIARDLPEERLRRQSLPLDQIPEATRTVLATLDANEVSTALSEGPNRVLLMLCGRSTTVSEGLDRAEVRRSLLNQRLGSYASGYLAELRADAVIVGLE